MTSWSNGVIVERRVFIRLLASSAVVWPLAAQAQQPSVPVIGFLHSGAPEPNARRLAGFRKGLADAGFVEGQNLTIEYRWAEGRNERLKELAADLVNRKVAVIVAVSSQPATMAAKAATTSIPIVFTWPGNPLDVGLVASLSRPGGNATGVSTLNKELGEKRLGLLRELVPSAAPVHVLINPNDPIGEEGLKDLQAAAHGLGVQLQPVYAGSDREIEAAFATMASKPGGALLVNADPFLFTRRALIVSLAARHKVPGIYYDRDFAASGGLMTYGTDLPSAWGQAANYVARILKGESPGDLPVAQPTSFELVINLKAAREIGIEVPSNLQLTADEVIE
jgi:putative tryptophan/tyrosine transport system substrate-binding protein